MNINRRDFLRNTALTAAIASIPSASATLQAQTTSSKGAAGKLPFLIDTNVHLFQWPFRHLKYGTTPTLVAKLRQHGVQQAWAGTFDAMFAKDMSGANVRLVEECRRHGNGFLLPVGGVNPLWPDWEEDLRRCHEVHKMSAIRLHPPYEGYSLEEPSFGQLLEKATARSLLVQICIEMEDPRVHHPIVMSPSVGPVPLLELFKNIPKARVQLLGDGFAWLRLPQAAALMQAKNLFHDVSSLEGVGGVGRLIEGKHWNFKGTVPIERFVFGSHAPYYPVENALLKLFESPLTLPQLEAIMEKNARRLIAAS